MNFQLLEKLKETVPELKTRYYKQLYVHEFDLGNTLKNYSELKQIPYINLNIAISQSLFDVEERRRPYHATDICNEVIMNNASDVICIDYFELLFETSLKVNPLELFKNISRNKTLLIAWRGKIQNQYFIYAEPGHPEYQKYTTNDAVVIK